MDPHLLTIQGLMIPSPKRMEISRLLFFFDRGPWMCFQRAGRIIPTARDNIERELKDLSQARVSPNILVVIPTRTAATACPNDLSPIVEACHNPLLHAICAKNSYRPHHGDSL